MTTKRQQTMAKITRERAVQEKRERKAEKKRLAKERKLLIQQGLLPPDDGGTDATEPTDETSAALLDSHEPDRDDGAVLGKSVVPGL
jgi:hypothetical protein